MFQLLPKLEGVEGALEFLEAVGFKRNATQLVLETPDVCVVVLATSCLCRWPCCKVESTRWLGAREIGNIIVSVGNIWPVPAHKRIVCPVSRVGLRWSF